MAAGTDAAAPPSLRLFEVVFVLAMPIVLVLALLWLGRPPDYNTARVIDSTVTSTDGESSATFTGPATMECVTTDVSC